ncbi:DUF4476 domain-containing protein [Hymenobacter glacialis]|uniref:DUF4476 domain-containing protein n=1 Tax=Hymenobacter glacialis TaxID=1908236 RepID=A0A1G1SQZ3_9BACT|nr:DUF4476 domain-containing protein [Hymenobacter glacialis]OGX81017.1 hypothetical protein BEN48_07630 [Hymenobacter glacialis]
MKKTLLLALAGLLAAIAPALAYPVPPANVTFASERGGVPFGLVLDGRPLTRGVSRQVHVDRLAPGAHWADFTVPTARGGAVRFRSRVWLEPGLETTFVLIARPGRPLGLQQVGAVALYVPGHGGYRSGYNDGYGPGHYNSPTPYGQTAPGSSYPYSRGNQSSDYDNNDPRYAPTPAAGSYRIMAPQDVDALMQTLQQRPSEASKLNIAREALGQSSIQADDLKRLLRSLSFESSRVELATFAYSRVADPQNFYRVYDSFDFDASVQEVQQAVSSQQRR